MLEIRSNCENCNKDLPPHSEEAMICAFECTFCLSCVEEVLLNVCPNCGGGFKRRPVLRKKYLDRLALKSVYKPVDMASYLPVQQELKDVPPHKR